MKKLFYLLMALPLLFVACEGKEPTPQPKPEKASLTLTSDEVVEFDAEGGEGIITFTYDGGTITGNDSLIGTTGQLKVSCEAEWVVVPSAVDLLGTIEYTVAKNQTADAREAKIVASIDDLSFEVTVKQAAASDTPEPEPSFEGWGIIGTINDWKIGEAILMEEANGYYVAKGVALSIDDKFKFI
ncbi:MAG: BACON domain-containing protein, partial [Alistipes sp.]|nr:BACON domain-containing protein [Alistipes sp.]